MLRKIYLILCVSASLFSQNGWQLTVKPTLPYYAPCIANGELGITPLPTPFRTERIILNDIYDRTDIHGVSRILQSINPINLKLSIDGEPITQHLVQHLEQTLNLKKAVFSSRFSLPKLTVSTELIAVKQLPEVVVFRIRFKALEPVQLELSEQTSIPDEYDASTVYQQIKSLDDQDHHLKIKTTSALSRYEKHQVAVTSAFISPQSILVKERNNNMRFTYFLEKGAELEVNWVSAICHDKSYKNPIPQAERLVVFAHTQGIETLLKKHYQAWEKLWESDIEIEGDDTAQWDIRLALFHLYGSINENTAHSIPPFGLSAQNYNGHIFWDTETWMLPPLLLLHPELAKSALEYRISLTQPAQQKAQSLGYRGMMFPWESDDSGEECTPPQYLTGVLEQHISADVGIALWDYFCVTKDTLWLKNKAFPVMEGIAEFWKSRVERNPDGSFSIKNVVGADEYLHQVDDNAFTNGAVKKFFFNLEQAYRILKMKAPLDNHLIGKLRIMSNSSRNITLENASYQGEIIKQADVNLLAYPLEVISDSTRIRNDLNYYASKIDPNGPAMTYSIFSILYSRWGEKDNAYTYFMKSYIPNKRPPFGVLSETSHQHNTYFLTAAGGLLQSVLNGFMGLYIDEKGITQKTGCLPQHWKKIIVKRKGKPLFTAQ